MFERTMTGDAFPTSPSLRSPSASSMLSVSSSRVSKGHQSPIDPFIPINLSSDSYISSPSSSSPSTASPSSPSSSSYPTSEPTRADRRSGSDSSSKPNPLLFRDLVALRGLADVPVTPASATPRATRPFSVASSSGRTRSLYRDERSISVIIGEGSIWPRNKPLPRTPASSATTGRASWNVIPELPATYPAVTSDSARRLPLRPMTADPSVLSSWTRSCSSSPQEPQGRKASANQVENLRARRLKSKAARLAAMGQPIPQELVTKLNALSVTPPRPPQSLRIKHGIPAEKKPESDSTIAPQEADSKTLGPNHGVQVPDVRRNSKRKAILFDRSKERTWPDNREERGEEEGGSRDSKSFIDPTSSDSDDQGSEHEGLARRSRSRCSSHNSSRTQKGSASKGSCPASEVDSETSFIERATGTADREQSPRDPTLGARSPNEAPVFESYFSNSEASTPSTHCSEVARERLDRAEGQVRDGGRSSPLASTLSPSVRLDLGRFEFETGGSEGGQLFPTWSQSFCPDIGLRSDQSARGIAESSSSSIYDAGASQLKGPASTGSLAATPASKQDETKTSVSGVFEEGPSSGDAVRARILSQFSKVPPSELSTLNGSAPPLRRGSLRSLASSEFQGKSRFPAKTTSSSSSDRTSLDSAIESLEDMADARSRSNGSETSPELGSTSPMLVTSRKMAHAQHRRSLSNLANGAENLGASSNRRRSTTGSHSSAQGDQGCFYTQSNYSSDSAKSVLQLRPESSRSETALRDSCHSTSSFNVMPQSLNPSSFSNHPFSAVRSSSDLQGSENERQEEILSNEAELEDRLDQDIDVEYYEQSEISREPRSAFGLRRRLVCHFPNLSSPDADSSSSWPTSISGQAAASTAVGSSESLTSGRDLEKVESMLEARERELDVSILSRQELAQVKITVFTEQRQGKWIPKGPAPRNVPPQAEPPYIRSPWDVQIDSRGILARKKLKSYIELANTTTTIRCPTCMSGTPPTKTENPNLTRFDANEACDDCQSVRAVEAVYVVCATLRIARFQPLKLPASHISGTRQIHIKSYVDFETERERSEFIKQKAVQAAVMASRRVLSKHGNEFGSRCLLVKAEVERRSATSVEVMNRKSGKIRSFDILDGIDCNKIYETTSLYSRTFRVPRPSMSSLSSGSTANSAKKSTKFSKVAQSVDLKSIQQATNTHFSSSSSNSSTTSKALGEITAGFSSLGRIRSNSSLSSIPLSQRSIVKRPTSARGLVNLTNPTLPNLVRSDPESRKEKSSTTPTPSSTSVGLPPLLEKTRRLLKPRSRQGSATGEDANPSPLANQDGKRTSLVKSRSVDGNLNVKDQRVDRPTSASSTQRIVIQQESVTFRGGGGGGGGEETSTSPRLPTWMRNEGGSTIVPRPSTSTGVVIHRTNFHPLVPPPPSIRNGQAFPTPNSSSRPHTSATCPDPFPPLSHSRFSSSSSNDPYSLLPPNETKKKSVGFIKLFQRG
ncbi:hypothetical protein IE53DRAFT_266313 [Violaceomyces palustris]|uniref:Uncharacterized protein n=1 Tax=Violaceomyces palustris TaxID=1673888 RepID=A0ACD0NMZ0_9BASI|nr:hypothetical protein IE53DRAFT_266313 [Violaceomyces palustris]